MELRPCDLAARPRVRGSELITRMADAAALATSDDEQRLWRLAARTIMPNLEYAISLDGMPAYTVKRYVPPAGVGLATIVVLDLALNCDDHGSSPWPC
jgi:hypothetical protein